MTELAVLIFSDRVSFDGRICPHLSLPQQQTTCLEFMATLSAFTHHSTSNYNDSSFIILGQAEQRMASQQLSIQMHSGARNALPSFPTIALHRSLHSLNSRRLQLEAASAGRCSRLAGRWALWTSAGSGLQKVNTLRGGGVNTAAALRTGRPWKPIR